MKIIKDYQNEKVISLKQANDIVERRTNNTTSDYLFIVKHDGNIISFSGQYYKFAWKTIANLKAALTNKFGSELAEALVENNVIEIIKIYI